MINGMQLQYTCRVRPPELDNLGPDLVLVNQHIQPQHSRNYLSSGQNNSVHVSLIGSSFKGRPPEADNKYVDFEW